MCDGKLQHKGISAFSIANRYKCLKLAQCMRRYIAQSATLTTRMRRYIAQSVTLTTRMRRYIAQSVALITTVPSLAVYEEVYCTVSSPNYYSPFPCSELGDGQVTEALGPHLARLRDQTGRGDLVLFRGAIEHVTRLCRVMVSDVVIMS